MGRGTTPPSNQSTFCIYTVDRNSNPFGEQNGVHACIEEMSPITTFFLNIPYGQSSAKLPVIQSSVIWVIRVIWVISSCHPVFPSSCHPVILSSCHPVILSSYHPIILTYCHPVILSSSTFGSKTLCPLRFSHEKQNGLNVLGPPVCRCIASISTVFPL